ncbi:MAG: hypothetical protein JNL42_18045 [Anaerolineae bacterium]|nr:hypothetical protein [Anaerolineae bacterium]
MIALLLRRHAAFLVGVMILMVWTGFRFDGLPFTPGARFSDAVTSHFPAALHFHRSIQAGQGLPIWRETILAGHPFAANPLNKTAYPPQWLAGVLPPVIHLNGMILVHLLIAYFGMARWARAQTLLPVPSTAAALAYAFAPRLIAHTGAGHLDVLYALAWFPWLMLSVQRAVTAQQRRLFYALALGLAAALMLLADLRVSLFALALAAGYGIVQWLQIRSLRPVGVALTAVAVMLLLTLSLSLPLLVWMPWLSRSGLAAQEAGVFAMQPAQWVGLVFAPQTGSQETVAYVGLPVLILAIFALVRTPRRHLYWALALITALIYALGENAGVWSILTRLVPALLWFRVPARAWLIGTLVLPLLAGYGLQALMEEGRRGGGRRFMILGVGLASAGGFSAISGMVPAGMAVGLLTGSGLSLFASARAAGKLTSGRLGAVALGLILIDLLAFGQGWLEWRGEPAWMPGEQRALAEALLADDAGRIYSPTYTLEQQTAALYDLALFGGVDPFQVSAVAEAVRVGGGIAETGYSITVPPLIGAVDDGLLVMANRDATPRWDVLARWGVTHIVSAYALDVDDTIRVGESYIYRNPDPNVMALKGTIPDWADGWQGLPEAADAKSYNDITALSAAFSAGAFVAVLILFLLIGRVRRR